MTVCIALLTVLAVVPMLARADTVKLKNGLDLFYKTSGIGFIPVVCIHGYSLSSATWDKIPALLPARYRFYSIDLRGFGDSGKPDTGYTYRDMVDDVAQFLDAMHLEKVILAGHSMGGMILQHFAVVHPERVLALLLSNTYAMNIPPLGMSEFVQKRIDGYGTKEENRTVFSKTMPLYFDASNLASGDIEKFVEIGLKASNVALKEMLKTLYTTPPIPAEHYGKIKAPTLIILGAHDPFADMKSAVSINDGIKNSKIVVVSYSRHTPMWERPEVWVDEVIDFLEERGL